MLSESVYNFAATSRRNPTTTGDPDSDSQQYDSSSQTATPSSATQLQLAASIQQQGATQPTTPAQQSKPRNKRKNFKPISSRMAEVSDESDEREDDSESAPGGPNDEGDSSSLLDYERKTMLPQPGDERLSSGPGGLQGLQGLSKQRLNNNEVIPMDLSVATRPPSSEADDDSGDSFRHKFILEQLRSQKLYSPSNDVSCRSR